MNWKNGLVSSFLFAIILTALFYRQYWGLNILLTEVALFVIMLFTKQYVFKGKNPVLIGVGLLLSAFNTVLVHSELSYVVNFILLFLFVGNLISPRVKSLFNAMKIAILNFINAQIIFVEKLSGSRFIGKGIFVYLWKARIFIVPVFIILLFIFLYKNANPIFDELVLKISHCFGDYFYRFFEKIDFLLLPVFAICLGISNLFFTRIKFHRAIDGDLNATDELLRKRKTIPDVFHPLGLKNEFKAGVFLLIILNILLCVVNSIDIYWVWFNFKWQGQYLKQFVHEGTYLLILSLLISIGLVLYFYRGNLNFYIKHKFLKYLSYAWLGQNALLAISVFIRNFRYIEYFSLAYKRIGVILFLILVMYGLYTVFLKVQQQKSIAYLLKKNSYFLTCILIIVSCINWDTVIAKYNFKHADSAFLHLDYLATLSDKALPILDKTEAELAAIELIQKEKFTFDGNAMKSNVYKTMINQRKESFYKSWESKNFLSWNFSEYMAYKSLKKKE